MTPEEFISIANQAESWIIRFLSVTFTLAIFFYVRVRAGSSCFIRERFWRILGGRKNFYRSDFQEEWQRLCDLEKFNYSTGIRLPSHEKAIELLQWLKDKRINLEELIRTRKYFNRKTFSIIQPRISHSKIRGAMALAFLIMVTPIFAFSGNGALLKIKKTGTYIWVSDGAARALSTPHWIISKEDCEATTKSSIEHDMEVSCSALSDKNNKEFLRKAIYSQQLLASLLFLLSGIILISTMRGLSIAQQAAELYERANKTVDNGVASTTESNG